MSSEPVGSLAEEAAKLIAVVQGWANDHGIDPTSPAGSREPGANEPGHPIASEGDDQSSPETDGQPHRGSDDEPRPGWDDHSRHDTAFECRWCPLCQLARAAKATSPEVREHLTSAALSLALAFKGLMESVDATSERADPVEKIDLDPDPTSPED